MSWHLASARSNTVQDASAESQGFHALSCVYAMEDIIETEDNESEIPRATLIRFVSIYLKPFVLLYWNKQPEKVATAHTVTIHATS